MDHTPPQSIRLTDITLTAAQHRAFLAFLDERGAAAEQAAAAAVREQDRRAYYDRCYTRVEALAREIARLHGPMPGMTPTHQAEASWRAFLSSEAFYSPLDVDEHFDPTAAPEFGEGWILAYLDEVERMERSGIKPVRPPS